MLSAETIHLAVEMLLRAFWVLCTLAVLVTALDLPVPRAFKSAVQLSAARGKTWDTRPRGLGSFSVRSARFQCGRRALCSRSGAARRHETCEPARSGRQTRTTQERRPTQRGGVQNASVPQAWFLHFYVVGAAANAATLALQALHLAATVAEQSAQRRFLTSVDSAAFGSFCSVAASLGVTALLQFHLTRRLLESAIIMQCATWPLQRNTAYGGTVTKFLHVPHLPVLVRSSPPLQARTLSPLTHTHTYSLPTSLARWTQALDARYRMV